MSSRRTDATALRHRHGIVRLIGLAGCLLAALPAAAIRLMPEPEQGRLAAQVDAMRLGHSCPVPKGTLVRILGTPTDPGRLPSVHLRVVRVLEGPCLDYGATVSITLLEHIEPLETGQHALSRQRSAWPGKTPTGS